MGISELVIVVYNGSDHVQPSLMFVRYTPAGLDFSDVQRDILPIGKGVKEYANSACDGFRRVYRFSRQ